MVFARLRHSHPRRRPGRQSVPAQDLSGGPHGKGFLRGSPATYLGARLLPCPRPVRREGLPARPLPVSHGCATLYMESGESVGVVFRPLLRGPLTADRVSSYARRPYVVHAGCDRPQASHV